MTINKTIKPFIIKYKPELLMSIGISGFIATSIFNIRSTIKSVHKVEEERKRLEMSKICQITGKKAMIGCNVSHSKRRTKRHFDVNLFTKKFYYVEQDCWISLSISAAGLRVINKVGLDAALKQAVEKGYCDWKNIKVIG